MRLYKPKQLPKQQRDPVDSSPVPPSSPPRAPGPYRLKRAAEAVSKQISGHKAMVALFKESRLPRPPIFVSKAATPPQNDRSVSAKPSKAAKASGKPQVVPKPPTSSVKPTTRSGIKSNSRSPTKPPGLSSQSAKKSSTLLSAPGKSESVPPPIHSLPQTVLASPAAPPTGLASTGTHLTNTSATSTSVDVDVDGPILFVSCFYSAEEDPELDDNSFEPMELSSADFDAQVARIFSKGLGPTSDNEIIRYGEMPPPTVTPQATSAPTLEPMSAVVEWCEPRENTAVQCESKRQSDRSETISPQQNQLVCVPKDLPRQPQVPLPSSADYEYAASLDRDAFRALSLGIHKYTSRKCWIKTVSNAIVEEETIVRTILEEQRIMREASGYPFLLGLMASFRDANGFHLVSVSFNSPLLGDN
jgi:hypothetical protein